jgi:predicted DNA-binding transcriptional regulator AlpA
MTQVKQYLRATEIAALTGLALRTVRRRISDGTFPSTSYAAPGSWRRLIWRRRFRPQKPIQARKRRMMLMHKHSSFGKT